MIIIIFDRKSTNLGIWLGLRRWMGSGDFPLWRRSLIALRQGERGNLLQGEENSSRRYNRRWFNDWRGSSRRKKWDATCLVALLPTRCCSLGNEKHFPFHPHTVYCAKEKTKKTDKITTKNGEREKERY